MPPAGSYRGCLKYFLLFFLGGALHASLFSQPLTNLEENLEYNLTGKFEYFEDPGKKLGVNEVMAQPGWKKAPEKTLNLGYTSANIWIRLSVSADKSVEE